MSLFLIRRASALRLTSNSYSWLKCSKASLFGLYRGYSVTNRLNLSPLYPEYDKDDVNECKVQLMDDETWRVSSGLVDAWRGNALKTRAIYSDEENQENVDEIVNSVGSYKEDHDFDEIEDMRVRGNLFYKLDKDSKEYQEYSFEFHRRKSHKNEKGRKENKENKKREVAATKVEKASKKNEPREIKKSKECKRETLTGHVKDEYLISRLHEMGHSSIEKKQRTLTFNQQTAPYHEPFCLDIYLSSGSVRASIIHRATSNVVVVSHSISKDMKYDLSSTKNRNACAAVGEVLAERALADDIHNVVYTPRKGEKLDGKLQIVLNSIIDKGINVKVKLKQRKLRKATGFPPRTPPRTQY